MWGKEVSAMVRKETKKRKKKHNFTCLRRQAMAAVGVGAKEKRNGGVVVCVPPDGVVVILLRRLWRWSPCGSSSLKTSGERRKKPVSGEKLAMRMFTSST